LPLVRFMGLLLSLDDLLCARAVVLDTFGGAEVSTGRHGLVPFAKTASKPGARGSSVVPWPVGPC